MCIIDISYSQLQKIKNEKHGSITYNYDFNNFCLYMLCVYLVLKNI